MKIKKNWCCVLRTWGIRWIPGVAHNGVKTVRRAAYCVLRRSRQSRAQPGGAAFPAPRGARSFAAPAFAFLAASSTQHAVPPLRLYAVTLVTAFAAFTALPPAALAADCKVVDPELQGFYQGGCRHGLANGYGHARGTAAYEGEFRNGLKHGKGVKTWAWGDRYEGGFLDDRKSGRGMYTWGAGSPWAGERFVGDYVADQREGRGTYYWPNGDRFEGEWKADRRYGYSVMELRRQATEAAHAGAITAGAQVCSWGRVGIAYKLLQVGQVEAVDGNVLKVRLLRLEGPEQAVSASSLQPGTVLDDRTSDWTPCS
jgi:hypothetical protein